MQCRNCDRDLSGTGWVRWVGAGMGYVCGYEARRCWEEDRGRKGRVHLKKWEGAEEGEERSLRKGVKGDRDCSIGTVKE